MRLTEIILHSNLPVRELSEAESSKLKRTLLEMYKDIAFACEKEGLTVFLGGGSCLGAVRHKGFIPWDDDIDLNMLRADYDRFPAALKKHFPEKYDLRGPGLSEDYFYQFIKIEKRGTLLKTIYDFEDEKPQVGIDLFPIENIPDNKLSRLVFGFRNNLLNYIGLCVKLYLRRDCPFAKLIYSTKEGKKSLRRRFFMGQLFSFRNYKKWYEKGDRLAQKYKNRKTKCTSCPTGRKHFFGEILELADIFPPSDCIFEGVPSKIYGGHVKYLSALFGNYMQLPPPEKREKHFIVDMDLGK